MKGDVRIPATEVEIAEAMRWSADPDGLVIRKLAFERDMLKAQNERYQADQRLLFDKLPDVVIENMYDWVRDAFQASLQSQNDSDYSETMRRRITSRMCALLGMPTPD